MSHSINSVNKFSLMCSIIYVLYSIAFRFLLPFGDEPDFTIRAPRFVLGELELIPEFIYAITNNLDYVSYCKIDANFYSYLSSLDYSSCVQDIYQISNRLLLQYLLISIPFLMLCYRTPLYFIFKNEPRSILDKKLDALSITFVSSSFLYYFGVIGWEQIMLLVSCFLILALNRVIVLLVLFIVVALLDIGDSIVVIYSASLYFYYKYILQRSGVVFVYLSVIVLLVVSYVFSTSLVTFAGYFEILSSKADAITLAYENVNLHDKYPILLRPIITFMTLVLYLPSGIRSIAAISIAGVLILILIRRSFSRNNIIDHGAIVYFLVIITVVFSIVFILPGYANGKYYVFMMPMFFYYALNFFSNKKVLLSVCFLNFICLFELVLFYLNY